MKYATPTTRLMHFGRTDSVAATKYLRSPIIITAVHGGPLGVVVTHDFLLLLSSMSSLC